jgi:hypothetical protein
MRITSSSANPPLDQFHIPQSNDFAQKRPILVELAGEQGVGKSTIAPLLGHKLRAYFGSDMVVALPENHLPRQQRKFTHWQRRCWLALHPRILFKAIHDKRCKGWMNLFSTLGIARQLLVKNHKVALIEQGVLRFALRPDQIDLLPDAYLPDLVIHLHADQATLALRRLLRNKKVHHRFAGARREAEAYKVKNQLHGLADDLIEDGIRAFSRKFCIEPLSEDVIQEILSKDTHSTASHEFLRRCNPQVLKHLQSKRTPVKLVSTNPEYGVEECVDKCFKEIIAFLNQ